MSKSCEIKTDNVPKTFISSSMNITLPSKLNVPKLRVFNKFTTTCRFGISPS